VSLQQGLRLQVWHCEGVTLPSLCEQHALHWVPMLKAGVSRYHSIANNIHGVAGETKRRSCNRKGVASYFVRSYFS